MATHARNNVAGLDSARLSDLLARQRAAFLRNGPRRSRAPGQSEKASCGAARAKGGFEAALDADFGHRSRHETAIMEMLVLAWGIDYLHRNLRRFMRPERRHVALPMRLARAYVEYQPLGVIGIMAPWNYPLSLALMPLATALAAGNRAMIKPSESRRRRAMPWPRCRRDVLGGEVAVVTGEPRSARRSRPCRSITSSSPGAQRSAGA